MRTMEQVRTIEHWIGGTQTPGMSTRHAPVWNPATGEQQAQVLLANTRDVDEAVRAAATAFEKWSQSSLSARSKILFKFRELVNGRIQELAEIMTGEVGMPMFLSQLIQAGLPQATSATIPALVDEFAWEEQIGSSLVVKEPVGVVAREVLHDALSPV